MMAPEASGFQGIPIHFQSTVHMLVNRFPFACSAFAHRARGVAQAPKRPAAEPGARPASGVLLRFPPARWRASSQVGNLRAQIQA